MTFLFVWPSCDSWRLGGINCYPLRLSQMAPRRLGIDLFCTFFLSFFFIFFLFTSLCRLLCSFTYIPVCSAVVFSGRTKKIWRGRHKGTCAFIFFVSSIHSLLIPGILVILSICGVFGILLTWFLPDLKHYQTLVPWCGQLPGFIQPSTRQSRY